MRRVLVTALAAAAVAACAPTAGAAPSLTATGESQFPQRSFVLTLPGNTQARAGQISVSENGGRVAGLKVEPVNAARRTRLGIVLVVDTSRSMRGQPVTQAFEAAQAFARERTESQPLGLVTFNSDIEATLPLTTDPFAIQEGLASAPEAGGKTRLYDAGLEAVQLIRESNLPGGFIVMLSDGDDYGSESNLSALTAAARDAHVRVYTVGLDSPRFDPTALEQLATSAGGTYTEAGALSDLNAIYSTLSAELSNAYIVRYRSVAEPRVDVDVTANVRGVGSASTAYTTPALAINAPDASDGSGWSSSLAAVLVAVLLGGLVALMVVTFIRRSRKTARERVEEYVASRDADPAAEVSLSDRLASGTERSLSRAQWWQRFSEDVDIAGLALPASRLATNAFGIAVAVGLLLTAATGQAFLFAISVLAAPVIVTRVVRSRVRRQRRLFADQLADHLAVVGSTLRAGHSFPAALAAGLGDAPQPTRREFERVVADERLGAPLDESLEELARRMDSREVEQVALLALLQRESGADAAEMLDGVVTTIRERQGLQRTVRTLTAQGRLSRTILSLLPVVTFALLVAVNSEYVEPLWTSTIGVMLSVLAIAMVITGSLIIKRIAEFEI